MNSKQAEAARLKLEQFGRQCQELRERAEKAEAKRDQLRDERDELSRDWDSEHYHRLAVERERDALAARNAELHDVAGILLCIDQCESCRVDGEFDRDGVKSIINREPPASLAQLDARIAYETISGMTFPTMLRKMWSGGEVQAWLQNEAEKHRQQAERDS